MPYIKNNAKEQFDPVPQATNVGELNYLINRLAIAYLRGQPKLDYATLNGTYGAMQLAAAEFKRRLIDPYEEKKIEENGDIFPDDLLDEVSVFSIKLLRKALNEENDK